MSVAYTRDQFSSACDNITTGPYTNIVASVGGYIYKNASGQTFKDHIKDCLEVNAGAHYYIQSQYTNTYASASATIDLSQVSINTKQSGTVKRHGFIELSMVTAGTIDNQCDIGLGNYGAGWRPETWCRDMTKPGQVVALSPDSASTGMGVVVSNQSAIVDITFTVSCDGTNDKIEGIFKIGSNQIAKVTYTRPKGSLFVSSSNKPSLRFVRFMSLVPLSATTDDADNTTMEATIKNLKLGSTTWDASKIEYAWSAQGANLDGLKISTLTSPSVAPNADYIKVNHHYQLH